MQLWLGVLITLAGFLTACAENKLRSGGGNGKSNAAAQGPGLMLQAPCHTSQDAEHVVVRPPSHAYTLTAEVCPKGVGSMSVAFIVDFSQSNEFPAELQDRYGPGNDPLTNDRCARLDAAAAVIKNIKSRIAPEDQVDISVIPFSSELIEEAKLNNVPLNAFDDKLIPEHFCGTDALTNYASGFAATDTILQSSDAQHKVVYFITDGIPYIKKLDALGNPIPREDGLGDQVDGETAQKLGREAMATLRTNNQDVRFYSLFLGNKVEDPKEAVAYLNSITGAQNVKVASEASKLADEIVKFSLPGLAIQPDSVRVTLDKEGLPIASVTNGQNDGSGNKIVTGEFKVKGASAEILIEATTVSGKAVSKRVKLTSEQQ